MEFIKRILSKSCSSDVNECWKEWIYYAVMDRKKLITVFFDCFDCGCKSVLESAIVIKNTVNGNNMSICRKCLKLFQDDLKLKANKAIKLYYGINAMCYCCKNEKPVESGKMFLDRFICCSCVKTINIEKCFHCKCKIIYDFDAHTEEENEKDEIDNIVENVLPTPDKLKELYEKYVRFSLSKILWNHPFGVSVLCRGCDDKNMSFCARCHLLQEPNEECKCTCRICIKCNRAFETKNLAGNGKWTEFCMECRKLNAHASGFDRICVLCSASFHTNKHLQKFCTSDCALKNKKRLMKERRIKQKELKSVKTNV